MNLKCSAQRVLIIVYTLAISIHQSQYRTHFIFSKRFPFVSLQSITPSNKAALICFLLLCISFVCSRTSYKWIRAVYILSCLAFLAGHNVFEIHSCCCVDLQFLSFPSSVLSWEHATVCSLIAIPMSRRQPSWRPSPLGTGRGSLSGRLWGRKTLGCTAGRAFPVHYLPWPHLKKKLKNAPFFGGLWKLGGQQLLEVFNS